MENYALFTVYFSSLSDSVDFVFFLYELFYNSINCE